MADKRPRTGRICDPGRTSGCFENKPKPCAMQWPNIGFSAAQTNQLSPIYLRRIPPTKKFWGFLGPLGAHFLGFAWEPCDMVISHGVTCVLAVFWARCHAKVVNSPGPPRVQFFPRFRTFWVKCTCTGPFQAFAPVSAELVPGPRFHPYTTRFRFSSHVTWSYHTALRVFRLFFGPDVTRKS